MFKGSFAQGGHTSGMYGPALLAFSGTWSKGPEGCGQLTMASGSGRAAGIRKGRGQLYSVDMLCDLACFALLGISACFFLHYFISQILSEDSEFTD